LELSDGFYAWDDEEIWWNKVEEYLKYHVEGFISPTDEEIAAMVLILYKSFAPKLIPIRDANGKKKHVPEVPNNKFCKVLGDKLSIRYKITIDRNT
jgi:hypothetical protein